MRPVPGLEVLSREGIVREIGVAVAGTGFGARTIVPAIQSLEGARVLALSGGDDLGKTREIAQAHAVPIYDADFESLCANDAVDLVVVASPHEHHSRMVSTALSHHRHILCEKPLALTTSEMVRLVSKSREDDRLHLMDHQLRFHPPIRQLRELVRSGALGVLHHIDIRYEADRYTNPRGSRRAWWFDRSAGGGMITAMGPHLVDLIQQCFGNAVRTVFADARPVLSSILTVDAGEKRVEVESSWTAQLGLENGVLATVSCTAASFRTSLLEIGVVGSEGQLRFTSPNGLEWYRLRAGVIERDRLSSNDENAGAMPGQMFHEACRAYLEAIVRAIQTGDRSALAQATDFEDYLYKDRILNAIRMSADERTVVEI
jgi:predicted dehydrogenase